METAPTGYIYFIAALTPDGMLVKIGYTGEHPYRRWQAIRQGSLIPLYRWAYIEGTRRDEEALHERFRKLRHHGEWFRVDRRLGKYLSGLAQGWAAEKHTTDFEIAVLGWLGKAAEDGREVSLEWAMAQVLSAVRS